MRLHLTIPEAVTPLKTPFSRHLPKRRFSICATVEMMTTVGGRFVVKWDALPAHKAAAIMAA